MVEVNKEPTAVDILNALKAVNDYVQETNKLPDTICVGTENGLYITTSLIVVRDTLMMIESMEDELNQQRGLIADLEWTLRGGEEQEGENFSISQEENNDN